MTVLLWGAIDDAVVQAVASECERLDVRAVALDGECIVSVDPSGDVVARDGRRLHIDDISGVLVRPEGAVSSPESMFAYQALTAWTETSNIPVLNRQSAGATNRSKPYQLALIAQCGFAVPDTLVTTDPEDVRNFAAKHERVVYKSTSGVRSIVSMLGSEDDERLDDITTCPTQFQQFVTGIDYRVHVVGSRVFASKIESSAIDYRYASCSQASVVIERAVLPKNIDDQCCYLANSLGLLLSGIDLRRDSDGRWYCFEVNTAPGFVWFETAGGHNISAAVVELLVGGECTRWTRLPADPTDANEA